MELKLDVMEAILCKAENRKGAGWSNVEIKADSVVVYGDIHGEPEAAAEALADAKAGRQVVVLGDLAYRSASWENRPGQMLKTLLLLFEAMTDYGAVLLKGNCDSSEYGLMAGVIIDDTYPDLITARWPQLECARRFCRVLDRLPVVATTPTAMLAHGCLTQDMKPEEVMWSVFNPEVEVDRIYDKFGKPSLEVGWQTVQEKLACRSTLLIGHQKKAGVKKQGYQVDADGDYQVVCLMSSSQNSSVKEPVKCLLNGNDVKFEPVLSCYDKFGFEEGH